LEEHREILREIFPRFHGTEIKTMGDAFLVEFNSALEAAQCAIAIQRALAKRDADAPAERQIQVRIGIHIGDVVHRGGDVYGDGVNIASRIEPLADAGGICVSMDVERQIRNALETRFEKLAPTELKNISVAMDLFRIVLPWEHKAEVRGQKSAVREKPVAVAKGRFALIGGLVLLVIIGIGWWWMTQSRKNVGHAAAAPSIPEKSIAVLPFENLSEEKANAFFTDGVQDEILTDLSKIADLKVISRTSVMKYKSDMERNLRDIANALGVSHVVEGSVQRAGDRVRVNVQLIDARNDTHLWAEHYDRDVADVFAVQTEIAERIADQLRAKLSVEEKAAIAERPTADAVAYAYYTKAKETDLSENWEGMEKSLNQKVELLEKALQRDPNFALACCELAKTHIDFSPVVGESEHRKHLELAMKAAETAVRLRPDLGEAHLELARYYFYAFDYDRTRDELMIVRSKLPNNAEALVIDAMIGRHENQWDASLANLRKASELDPRNGDIAFRLAAIYFEMRRYSELEQFLTRAGASGTFDKPLVWLARIKLAQGDPVAAQSLLEQVPLDYSPGPWIWDVRFTAALYLRDYDAADRVIAATPAKWVEIAFSDGTSDWAYGKVARVRGDKEKALAAFTVARKKLEAKLADKPNDPPYLSDAAKLDAGLGRKEDAIREAQRAVELEPIAKDAVNGPVRVTALALVYAWTGERDAALEQLEKVATIPGVLGGSVPTYGDLLLNPCWDDLRGDPRFDKIVAAAKAASK
jgi:TolB-like protein/Tfp pilus assembly protein PilF